jgi:hypothetical protein
LSTGETCCKVLLSFDTVRDRYCEQQRFLIPLPQVVVVRYTLSMLLGYPDTESGGDIDDDVLLSRCALLYYTLLSITKWFRRFSARRAERCAGVACSEVYKTLRSASRTGGQDRRYHSSPRELPPRPCALAFANVDIVLPFIEQAYAKTDGNLVLWSYNEGADLPRTVPVPRSAESEIIEGIST